MDTSQNQIVTLKNPQNHTSKNWVFTQPQFFVQIVFEIVIIRIIIA